MSRDIRFFCAVTKINAVRHYTICHREKEDNTLGDINLSCHQKLLQLWKDSCGRWHEAAEGYLPS